MSSSAQIIDSDESRRHELRIREELDSALLLRLKTLLPLAGLLYVVVTVSQFMLLGWTLTAPLTWVNSLSAAVCVVLTASVWKNWVRPKWANATGFVARQLAARSKKPRLNRAGTAKRYVEKKRG